MNPLHARPAPAFTIIELMLALAISAIVMTSVPLMISLSSRAAPTAGGIQLAASETADCFAQLTADLQIAQAITAVSATSITMSVPARDGSDTLQTITYAWGGTPGDPVKVDIDGQASVLVAAADDFSLTPTSGTHTVYSDQTFTESKSVTHHSATGTESSLTIPPAGSCIQVIAAPSDPGVIGWTLTDLDIYLACAAAVSGESVVVSVIPLNSDHSPATGTYATQAFDSSDLKTSLKKVSIEFPPLWLAIDEFVGIEFTVTSTSLNAFVGTVATPGLYSGGALYASAADAGPWSAVAGSVLYHEAQGTTLTGTGGAADRNCLERLDVSITTGDGGWVFATSITPLNRVGRP